MEVKRGYKRTEAGVIPEDWHARSLKGLATSSHGFGFHSEYFAQFGKYRLMTPGHFYDTGGFREIGDKQKYYAGPLPDGYLLKRDDLLVVMTEQADGLLGSAAMVPADGAYLHNQRLGKVRALSPDISIGFLYRTFNFPLYRSKVRETAAGTKVKHTSPARLLDIVVPIPPTKLEQDAIAEALSDADALIESLRQLLAKKREIKQGAMQELLTGTKRLPGFTGAWQEKPIGQFTDCTAGGTPSTLVPRYWGGPIRWMSSGELHLKIVAEVEGRITDEGLRNSSTKMVPANCVLVGLAGQGKTRGTVAINLVPLCTNQSIAAIFPNGQFVPKFLYYNLDSRYEELRELSTGDGGRGGLNLTIIRTLTVSLPSIGEQSAIAAVLSDLDQDIDALQAKLAKAKAIRQGMMQELLTGRIRLV